jgi:hypothetical protein
MHHDPLTQETPASVAAVAPVGSTALDVIDQAVPFQISASGIWLAAVVLNPTAVQKVALRHETSFSFVPVEPVTLAAVTCVHADPFHCSASGAEFPVKSPTAMQNAGPAQLTLSSSAAPEPGVGTVASAQLVPFHWLMTMLPVVLLNPTPTQNVLLAHVTPLNCEFCEVEGEVGSEAVKVVAPTCAGGVGMVAPA